MVIRGICDYADPHKTKAWQEYIRGSNSQGYSLTCSWLGTGNDVPNGE